jgi:hypothetical protein
MKPNTMKPHTMKPHTMKPHTMKPNTLAERLLQSCGRRVTETKRGRNPGVPADMDVCTFNADTDCFEDGNETADIMGFMLRTKQGDPIIDEDDEGEYGYGIYEQLAVAQAKLPAHPGADIVAIDDIKKW